MADLELRLSLDLGLQSCVFAGQWPTFCFHSTGPCLEQFVVHVCCYDRAAVLSRHCCVFINPLLCLCQFVISGHSPDFNGGGWEAEMPKVWQKICRCSFSFRKINELTQPFLSLFSINYVHLENGSYSNWTRSTFSLFKIIKSCVVSHWPSCWSQTLAHRSQSTSGWFSWKKAGVVLFLNNDLLTSMMVKSRMSTAWLLAFWMQNWVQARSLPKTAGAKAVSYTHLTLPTKLSV